MNDRLRTGVIGLGWQGGSHLQLLAADPRVELVAGCDRDDARLAEQSEAWHLRQTFADYEAFLREGEVEAVVIVLPDHRHREAAIAALQAGKHVLLEKPMALTVDDAQAIAAAAERSGKCFMLNLSNRWMYPFAKGRDLLDGGDYGAVRYVFARMANRLEVPTERLPWLRQSHLAHWIGVHRLDIARWWIGTEAVRVRAVERKGVLAALGFDAADFFQATIEFDGGAVVNLECNWILPPTFPNLVDSRFYALCEHGVIDVDRMRSELEAVGPSGFERNTPTAGAALGQVGGFTFAAERHFVDCCLTGEEPLVGAADGLALTRVTCAIVESCRSDGAVIELS